MARKVWTGSSRVEILKRIFTEGVKQCAMDNGLALSDALSLMIEKNRPLWQEYLSGTLGVQRALPGGVGLSPGGGASAALASEMNAYAKENHISLAVALSEVCKSRPDLLWKWREEIATIV